MSDPMQEMFDNTPDGADLLDRVCDHWGRYICTVAASDLHLLTLWTVHTHLINEMYTTPRRQIDSPVPESGKTTVLEHLEKLCLRSCQMSTVSSPAMISRLLDAEMRTILIDEADRSLDLKKPGIEDILAILNSGYKKGGTRPVLEQRGKEWVAKEMPTCAPVALAGEQPEPTG